MKAFIVTIGDEILLGQILDTNSRFIAESLAEIGIETIEMRSVSDDITSIRSVVDESFTKSDVVVVTGGLGPTKDDRTKKVLADYFGMPLVFNEEAFSWVAEMVRSFGGEMNPLNRDQALMPQGCTVLRNRKGTAAGMWFERNGHILVSLPGVPFEMVNLMQESVLPALHERFPERLIAYKMVTVFSTAESMLAQELDEWEKQWLSDDFGLAYLPASWMVRLRVTAKGDAISRLNEGFEALIEVLKSHHRHFDVGNDVTGVADEIHHLFLRNKKSLATAESCTGGEIARQITSHAGCSAYFKGSVVAYNNVAKMDLLGVNAADLEAYGAVSEAVVRSMAEGARHALHADYAVATSGIAGPDGGTPEKPVGTVWIAASSEEKTVARCFQFTPVRERNIGKATTAALEMLLLLLGVGE